MKLASLLLAVLCLSAVSTGLRAQSRGDAKKTEKKYQAAAPMTKPFGAEAFAESDCTTLRWLGLAGFFINSHGTTLMVDPILTDYNMPLLIHFPVKPENVPRLDAVLITHDDNDHYSASTCKGLSSVTRSFHSTRYVDSLMKNEGLASYGHDIGDMFNAGNVRIKVTPADHTWQNDRPQRKRNYKPEDYCGFLIETPDGNIWAPGDTRLLPEHLKMKAPDAIFFDFSKDNWHFGLEGAVKLANTYPDTPLLLYHWGSIDAPDLVPFNADPKWLDDLIVNPERIHLLAPGESFTLHKL